MFITLTINTAQKKVNSPIFRVHKRNSNPAKGWRKAVHMQKRGVLKKLNDWKRSLRVRQYRVGGQLAMF